MSTHIALPARKGGPWALLWTLWIRWAFPRAFAALHVEGLEAAAPDDTRPTIFYANHCGWWDGFIGKLVMEELLGYEAYVPMEEANLRRFPTLTRLGAFGLNRGNPREALRALAWAEETLRDAPQRAVWIFPQGVLLPQGRRPLELEAGAALLASRLGARLVPVACHYAFRDRPKPEVFIRLGPPTEAHGPRRRLNAEMTETLTGLLDGLERDIAADSVDRDHPAIAGGRGVDALWEALKGWFSHGKRAPSP